MGLVAGASACDRPYPPGMELEVRHLRALCAIADTGSLHKAARQLGVSQPSLTTQLRRIEQRPGRRAVPARAHRLPAHPPGAPVLSRARPLVAEMAALVAEARAAAARAAARGCASAPPRAGPSPAGCAGCAPRLPGTDTTLQMDVSANALLRMVAGGQLDVAFVHEVEGCPLRVPDGLELRVLIDREPQFVSLSRRPPGGRAARGPTSPTWPATAGWSTPRWTASGTACAGSSRGAGLDPPRPARRLPHGRPPCRAPARRSPPASRPPARARTWRSAAARRPARRTAAAGPGPGTGAELHAVYAELAAAYREAARRPPAYRQWLLRHRSPLAHTS